MCWHLLFSTLTFEMFYLKNIVKINGCNDCIDVIPRRISTSIKVINQILTLALIISETLTFKYFDHQNLGQGRGVQYSQQSNSMVDIGVYL